MFVAHAAGGYLLTRFYLRNIDGASIDYKTVKYYLLFGLVCSVLPDIDLFYFYLFDHRQHPHHTYWTHIPLFWILFTGFLFFMAKAVSNRNWGLWLTILLLNTELHMILDSVAGGIYWLYPVNSVKYRLFEVTARYDWWVLNYIFHWTFMMELLIIVAAAVATEYET